MEKEGDITYLKYLGLCIQEQTPATLCLTRSPWSLGHVLTNIFMISWRNSMLYHFFLSSCIPKEGTLGNIDSGLFPCTIGTVSRRE